MKTNILTVIAASLALSACGSAAQYASSGQQFQDGFYSRTAGIQTKEADYATRSEVGELVKETENSRIFLKAGQTDTLYVPENMSTTLRFDKQSNSTVVTVTNEPSWNLYPDSWYGYGSSWWDPWYSPFRWSWYWGANPWYYSSMYWDPWYRDPWFGDPWYWHRGGMYWSWYYDPWYSPWYSHWYSPWYGYHHHYIGYDPCWGHIHGDISTSGRHWGTRALTSGSTMRGAPPAP